MKTQIIKKAAVKEVEYKVGQEVTFRYRVPLQNIGWTYKTEKGHIQKVNRVSVHVLDNKFDLWMVDKYDVVND